MLAKMQREARWKEGVACHSRAWKGCSLLYSQCKGESRKVRQKSGWSILRLLQLSINRDGSVFSPGLTPTSCSFSGQLEIHAGGTSPTGDPLAKENVDVRTQESPGCHLENHSNFININWINRLLRFRFHNPKNFTPEDSHMTSSPPVGVNAGWHSRILSKTTGDFPKVWTNPA